MPEIVDFGSSASGVSGAAGALSSFLGGFVGGSKAGKREQAEKAEQDYLERLRKLKISQMEESAAEDEAAAALQVAMTGEFFEAGYLDRVRDFRGTLFANISNELQLIPGVDYEDALTPQALRMLRDPNLSPEDRRVYLDVLKSRQMVALHQGEMRRYDNYADGQKANTAYGEFDENYNTRLDDIRDDQNISVPDKLSLARDETSRVRGAFVDSVQKKGAQDALNALMTSPEGHYDIAFMSFDEDTQMSSVNMEARQKWQATWEDYIAKGNYSAANGMVRALGSQDTRAFFNDLEVQIKTAEEAKDEANQRLGVALSGGYDRSTGKELDQVARPKTEATEPAPDYKTTTDDEGLVAYAEGDPDPGGVPRQDVYTEEELGRLEKRKEGGRQQFNPFEEGIYSQTGLQRVSGVWEYRAPEDRIKHTASDSEAKRWIMENLDPLAPEGLDLAAGDPVGASRMNPIYEAVDEFWKAGGGADGTARAKLHLSDAGYDADTILGDGRWTQLRDTHPRGVERHWWSSEHLGMGEALRDAPSGGKEEAQNAIKRHVKQTEPGLRGGLRGDREDEIMEDIEQTSGARGREGLVDAFIEYGNYEEGGGPGDDLYAGAASNAQWDLWFFARDEGLPLPVFATRDHIERAEREIGDVSEYHILPTSERNPSKEEYRKMVVRTNRPVDVTEPDPPVSGAEKEADRARLREERYGDDKYDYDAARRAGLGPDETGHWPSRIPDGPNEGLILKSPDHDTFSETVEKEKALGNVWWYSPEEDLYYTFPPGPPRISGGAGLIKKEPPSKGL